MVIEVLAPFGWGGLAYALDFVGQSLQHESQAKSKMKAFSEGVNPESSRTIPFEENQGPRPWCFLEASPDSQLYLPSLSLQFRKAASELRLLWLRSSEDLAPGLAQMLLESGLCSGVLLRGLDRFSKSAPAALWGRRWQLAARKGGSHLLWVHQKAHALIGFDVRLEWTSVKNFEIKKGYGYFGDGRKISYVPAA